MDLQELIRAFRFRLDLTQGQLADRIGVNEDTVRHWENRQYNVGPSALMKLLWLAEKSGDPEFPRAVKSWQSSADAERLEKLRSRAGDIRKPMQALIRNLQAGGKTADLLAEQAPTYAPKGESLADLFRQVADSLRQNAAWMEDVYEPLNNLMRSEKDELRHASRK